MFPTRSGMWREAKPSSPLRHSAEIGPAPTYLTRSSFGWSLTVQEKVELACWFACLHCAAFPATEEEDELVMLASSKFMAGRPLCSQGGVGRST